MILRSRLARYVPPFDVIAAVEWRETPHDCLNRIQKRFQDAQVAVRSSAHNEAAGVIGQAGRYRSFGPLGANSRDALTRAIASVFTSYGHGHPTDAVLVQAWVSDSVVALGVTSADATAFAGTASLSYYVGECTRAITAGWTNVSRFWLTQNATPARHWPSAVRRAFALLTKIELALGRTALELEIAVDRRGRLRLLQVTPSTRPSHRAPATVLEKRWSTVESVYRKRAHARDGELGRSPLFGLMPDWNTAELLGEHPRPLAASLFNALIADQAWRNARINLGYRKSSVHPLLGYFAGRPYVDVRASLGSLIPGGLPDALALPAIEAGIDKLGQHPELHDRVETDLFPTCAGFANECSEQLREAGVGKAAQSTWQAALIAMEPIWEQFSTLPGVIGDVPESMRNVTEEVWRWGAGARSLVRSLVPVRRRLALPFAMHARLAFVARFQLYSLVTAGALSQERLEYILSCVSAVNSIAGVNARQAGVLRPATFDICVNPVRRDVDADWTPVTAPAAFITLTTQERRAVSSLLRSLQLHTDAASWLRLAQLRIELRERWKYALSQALSYWFSALTRWGQLHDLSAEDLSYLTVKALDANRDPKALQHQIAVARRRYDVDATIKMPLLISSRSDFRASVEPALRPTFLGRGRVSGPLCIIGRHTEARRIAAGTVVLMHAADPGFDWIFAYPFAALITCYGGPHSHMAVRCVELNVPCVLGCGETVHGVLQAAACTTIDFDQRHMMVDA